MLVILRGVAVAILATHDPSLETLPLSENAVLGVLHRHLPIDGS